MNDVATCKCHSMFSGIHCEIESSQQKTIKSVSSTTSIIAIVMIVAFYTLILISDLLNFFCGIDPNSGGRKIKKVKRTNVKKLVYIN